MEFLATNKELTKEEKYFLTKAQDVQKMTEAVDQILDLTAWAIYTDVNADGEEVELFSMRTVDGETYATNSATFIRAFRDILDIICKIHSSLLFDKKNNVLKLNLDLCCVTVSFVKFTFHLCTCDTEVIEGLELACNKLLIVSKF